MLTYKQESQVERAFTEAEAALLADGGLGAAGEQLPKLLQDEAADGTHRRRLADLKALVGTAADNLGDSAYVHRWGFGGVRIFHTAGGRPIYQIAIRSFPGHDTLCYLLPGAEPVLIDVGSGLDSTDADWVERRRVLARVFGLPNSVARLRHLVISHGHVDHYGYVPTLLKEARPTVYCHELDARVLEQFDERLVLASGDLRRYLLRAGLRQRHVDAAMELFTGSRTFFPNVPVDVRLRHGSVIPGGGRVIHTPGHCAGLVCIRFDDLLYTADHLLQHVTPHQAPQALNPFFGLENYFASLNRVAAQRDVRLGLPAHGPLIHDIRGRAHEILYFHQRRLWQVLELCEEPATVADVSRALFGDLNGYNVILGLEEAGAHVEYLHQHGWLRVGNLAEVENGESPVIRYVQDPEALKRRKEPSVYVTSPRAG